MTIRTLLLVGACSDPILEVLTDAGFRVVCAAEPVAALDALDGKPPDVVLIHTGFWDGKGNVLRTIAGLWTEHPVPLLALIDPSDKTPVATIIGLGASDCFRLEEPPADVVQRVELLCKLGQLGGTVLNQQAMIGRHVDRVLASHEEVHSVRAELEAILEHGPLIMYSAEASEQDGAFHSADEIEHASFTHIDGTVLTLLGLRPDDLLGASDLWRKLVPGRDRPRLKTRAKRLFALGHHACEYHMRHADGRVRDEARVLRRGDGAAVAILGCLRDVTQERSTSEAIRNDRGLLLRAQHMEGVQQIAGTVAHDFNNMLGIIMCHAQYASRLLPNDHAAQKSLEAMLEAAVRAKAHTKLLTQLSRRDGRERSAVNVNALVKDTIQLVAPILGSSVAVSTELRPGLPRVRVDRMGIEHALINLCVNARDAMPKGGRLRIRTDVRPSQDGSGPAFVVIEVADSGMGMDDRVLKKCFEPFFTTKAQGAGTGLGLFSVLETMRSHNGTVTVETEPGRGSTLRLLLPFAQPRVRACETAQAPVSGTRGAAFRDAPAIPPCLLRGGSAEPSPCSEPPPASDRDAVALYPHASSQT